jgi:hypothetical protein
MAAVNTPIHSECSYERERVDFRSEARSELHSLTRLCEKSAAKRWHGRLARENKSESVNDMSSRAGRPCHLMPTLCFCGVFTQSAALVATRRLGLSS